MRSGIARILILIIVATAVQRQDSLLSHCDGQGSDSWIPSYRASTTASSPSSPSSLASLASTRDCSSFSSLPNPLFGLCLIVGRDDPGHDAMSNPLELHS